MDPSPATGSPGKNPILVYVLADTNDQAISDAILKHLKPIVRDFPLPIEIDSDFSAPPGADRERYQARLLEANIVLALISSDFIDNDALYARNQLVMDRHNRGQTVMIPVLIRNCMWKRTPFARLNVLPRNYQPLNNRQYWNSQDDAIMAVVEDIDRSLNELARQGAIEIAPAPAAAGPAPASAAARSAGGRFPAAYDRRNPNPCLKAGGCGHAFEAGEPGRATGARGGDDRGFKLVGRFGSARNGPSRCARRLAAELLLGGLLETRPRALSRLSPLRRRDGGGAAGRRQHAREFRRLGLARSDRHFSGLLLSGVSLLRVRNGGRRPGR